MSEDNPFRGGSHDDEGVKSLTLEDRGEQTVFLEGSDCQSCGGTSTGVVVTEHPSGEQMCKAVCEECLAALEESDYSMDFGFKTYK